MAVSPDGLLCQSREGKRWGGVRATAGVRSGHGYFEVTINDEGLARVGVSSAAGSFELGTDEYGWGFGGTGKKSNRSKFDDYGLPFTRGDVIGVAVAVAADGSATLSFSKNGEWLGEAFRIPPKSAPLFPAMCVERTTRCVIVTRPC